MQNPLLKFRQSSIIFRENRLFARKIENFDELQLPKSLIFFAEILHTFPTYLYLQKAVRDFYFV